jgi:hypothetical protein
MKNRQIIVFIKKFWVSILLFLAIISLPYCNPELFSNKTRTVAWVAGILFASPLLILPIYIHFFRKIRK